MSASIAVDRPIIVCALEYERAALMRAGLGELAELQCCGPDAAQIHAWAAGAGPGARTVMLCGLAGALSPRLLPGTAHMIDEALDERGTRWRSTPCAGAPSHEHCAIVSTAHIVTTVAAKAELAARTGADMVDLESAAFASEAQRLGWNWLIVRGVSDGAEDSLPHEIDQWVDATGRTRPGAVALSLLRQPTLAPSLWQLARTSRAAMNNAARLAQSLLASETRSR